VHKLTKVTSFYAVYGKHPLLSEPPKVSRLEREMLDTIKRVKRIHSARATIIEQLEKAREYQS
jgi:hypothetical protein